MRISSLSLHPFGGIAHKDISFQPGLNVVLGPNEAGKSTLYAALEKGLFLSSQLTKLQFKKELELYLPLAGGDTLQVALSFDKDSAHYSLSRSWGASKGSRLELPGGQILTDDKGIQEKIQSLLSASERTYQTVLMARQMVLQNTREDIMAEGTTLHQLGDILREAVLQTDGISVDAFKEKVEELYEEYFSHWDEERQMPEDGRGIINPWKNKVGEILSAWYRAEEAKAEFNKGQLAYDAYESAASRLKEKEESVKAEADYLQNKKDVYDKAGQRLLLAQRIKAAQEALKNLMEANRSWPVLEENIKRLSEQQPGLETKISAAKSELEIARKQAALVGLRQKYQRVVEKKALWEEAKKQLSILPVMEADELRQLQMLSAEIERLKAALIAGKLAGNLKAVKNLSLEIQKKPETLFEAFDIPAGAEFKLEAEGLLILKHPDWVIELASGTGEYQQNWEAYSAKKTQLEKLLIEKKLANLADAEPRFEAYRQGQQAVKNAALNYQQELGSQSWEELEERIKSAGEVVSVKSEPELVKITSDLEHESKSLQEKLNQDKEKLGKLVKEYNSFEELLLKVATETAERRKWETELAALSTDSDSAQSEEEISRFIADYKERKESYEITLKEIESLKIEQVRMEEQLPDASPEELEKVLKQAQAEFEKIKRKAEALARVRNKLISILAPVDQGTFTPCLQKMGDYFATVSGRRDKAAGTAEDNLPIGIRREDIALEIPYANLSTGTKDLFGLAIRLAMADYFLKGAEGFLVLDDPLVNLDPERQKKAAGLLSDYSQHCQVILFTCHPHHAEMLGGNLVNLG